MIALFTYPAAKPALSASSLGVRKQTRTAAFSDEVWELHQVIANPAARTNAVRMAKRQLLRRLRKFQPAAVSKESRRRSLIVITSPKIAALLESQTRHETSDH